MKNLKIGKKLFVTFGSIIVLFLITIIMSSIGLNYSGSQFEDFYTYSYPMSMQTLDTRRSIQMAMKDLSMSMLTEDVQKTQQYVTNTTEEMELALDNLNYLKQNYRGDVSRIEEAIQMLSVADDFRIEIQELSLANKNSEAVTVFFDEYVPQMLQIQDLVTAMDENTTVLADETFNNADRAQSIITLFAIGLSVVTLIVTILLATYLSSSLKKPISEIENAAKQMAEGTLKVSIGYESRDELGSLSDSMRKLCTGMSDIIDDIGLILAALAAGDFHIKSKGTENYKGDFMSILTSMRLIRDNLNQTMTQINQSADQVASGSEQVSFGSQALSQGATEQASAVEQLAATINEISAKVEQTAQNAIDARNQTAHAGEETNVCNQQMSEMIAAMDEISHKSTEIGKIIKTIEDIAFQTNILALNAAVEAARAGAAGKGFAVVADEVRNLASKSAEASQNTSALIESSVHAVEKGTRIANETAASLMQVVEGAATVATTVEKITQAMTEQSASIEQVTQGIDQISSVVQNNSATAEESAAASEELSGQAQMLKSLVSQFKLLDEHSTSYNTTAKPVYSSEEPTYAEQPMIEKGEKY